MPVPLCTQSGTSLCDTPRGQHTELPRGCLPSGPAPLPRPPRYLPLHDTFLPLSVQGGRFHLNSPGLQTTGAPLGGGEGEPNRPATLRAGRGKISE